MTEIPQEWHDTVQAEEWAQAFARRWASVVRYFWRARDAHSATMRERLNERDAHVDMIHEMLDHAGGLLSRAVPYLRAFLDPAARYGEGDLYEIGSILGDVDVTIARAADPGFRRAVRQLLGLAEDASDQDAIDELMGVVSEAGLYRLWRENHRREDPTMKSLTSVRLRAIETGGHHLDPDEQVALARELLAARAMGNIVAQYLAQDAEREDLRTAYDAWTKVLADT